MKSTLLHSVLGAGLLLLTSLTSHAALIYETNFTGSAGPFETAPGYNDWRVVKSAVTVSTSLELDGNGLLKITNPSNGTSNNLFGGAFYTGDSTISNGQIASVFQFVSNANQSSGVLARVQNPLADGSRPEGYFAGILRHNPGGGNTNYLVIAKDISFADVKTYTLASVEINVTHQNFYRLEFDFIGNTLSATLFNAAGNIRLATLNVTDTSYSEGAVGLRANFGTTDRSIHFDSFEVTSIPEPSTALLLLSAGAFVLHRYRQPLLRRQ